MSDEQPKKEKFKHTRELVKLALDDGMTQEEIGKLCRTQQSVVSGWKSGKSKATTAQIEPLLRRYGPRLRRTTARIYLLEPDERRPRAAPSLQVVEGPVIFRHVLTRPTVRAVGRNSFSLARDAITRVLVHELPGPRFVVLVQSRRRLSGDDLRLEAELLQHSIEELPYDARAQATVACNQHIRRQLLDASDDAARWLTSVDRPVGLAELLAWVDEQTLKFEHDAITLRFLLRKALLEHGHHVPDVARIPDAE